MEMKIYEKGRWKHEMEMKLWDGKMKTSDGEMKIKRWGGEMKQRDGLTEEWREEKHDKGMMEISTSM